jgi:diketogulonate reductase-like aldo/keto reductase
MMGVQRSKRTAEIAALRLGFDLGMTLVDTAEMYADGGAESVVGEAIKGRGEEIFLVSKVLPQHATRQGTIEACQRSLKRLGVETLDLYLLHWREQVPLEETLDAFSQLKRDGLIRDYGVSNFDVADMDDVGRLPGGGEIVVNQVYYNLHHRGIEFDLLAWCREHQLPIMAYSPVDQGRLTDKKALAAVATRHNVTPAQVALAWVLRQPDMIAIPKAAKLEHVRQNREVLDLQLTPADLDELDHAFPAPKRKIPLETT